MDSSQDSLLADVAAPKRARADSLVDPLLGTQLGNYEIIFVLGKGAYGTVYKARDVKLGRFVAIKFLHEFLDARHEAMFLREAKAIAALGKHPSIVQIFEWSEYQGRNYFVLEFVGSNAAMLLRVNPAGLPTARAAGIALDCAEALAYAHKQGIIHRDIKPANLLLEIEGARAKLADFGVARLFDPGSGVQSDAPGGTPGYMAPEIIRGEDGDARSDLFSLGVTLYELLCGKRPFEGQGTGEVLARTRDGDRVPLRQRVPQLSGALLRIVERAMAQEPAERYPNAESLAQDLRAFLNAGTPQPALSVDAAEADHARNAKTRAFKAIEDAKHAGADKLAHDLITAGIEAFRDGEAHERLRQFGPAAQQYEASFGRFVAAEELANRVMSEIRELKSAQRLMESARNTAESADAGELAAAVFGAARAEEEAARRSAALPEATSRYLNAQRLYEVALAEARRQGELTMHEPRKQLEVARRRASMMQAETFAPEEMAAAEELARHVAQAAPDYHAAARHCVAAIHRYNEAVRVAIERRRLESEKEAREPIVVAGIEFIWIPPGEFRMGDPDGPPEERPAHTAALARGFWLGKYLVTQGQWQAIAGSNPSGFTGDDWLPVENVSWEEAKAFIEKLNALGQGVFRLPSEAEWEYACRAGSAARWSFGDDADELDACAWTCENASGRTHPVAQKRPNAWGLHDMHGNVCEWCEDHWHPTYEGAPADGSPWLDEGPGQRVTRGGSWCVLTPDCTSATRAWYAAQDSRTDFVGLRIARNK